MTHEKGRDPEWTTSFVPFSVDLYDAVQTARGPYAVGGGGTVARKHEGGWEALIQAGPSGQGSKLRSIAATDDGQRVWFAGSAGALGMYDLRKGEKQDYSYSGDATTSWREIAVTGEAGEERALLANGSGTVVSFTVDGQEVTFSEPTEPGQGDTVQALATTSEGVGYAVDGAGAAYRANPEGWTRMGTVNAGTSLTDIYADTTGRLLVSATNGKLYQYERSEETWTPIDVAKNSLLAVDVFQEHVVALASGATFYSRPLEGAKTWHRTEAATGNNLVALALGYPDVAVGKSGTIVERPRQRSPEKKGKKKEEKKSKTGGGTEGGPAPPVDPCTVLTEGMIEELEAFELLELVEEYACASPFTETVAERLKLQEYAEHRVHLGEPPHELTVALVERLRRSERYVLRCLRCDERVLCPPEPTCPPKRVRKKGKKKEKKKQKKGEKQKKKQAEGACTCGRWPRCECPKPPEEPEAALRGLKCQHCGHAVFYVDRVEHTFEHGECCDGHEHGGHHEAHSDCGCGGHHDHSGCGCGHEHHEHHVHHEHHEHGCGCGGGHEHHEHHRCGGGHEHHEHHRCGGHEHGHRGCNCC